MPNQFDPKPSIDQREIRGHDIAQNFGWVRRVDETSYMVHSQRLDREYRVEQTETGWMCECPDSTYRLLKCKHVWAVEISWELRRRVEQATVIQPVSLSKCPSCGASDIVKHGLRHNQYGDLQRYSCRDCGKRFVQNLGFERMKATPRDRLYGDADVFLGNVLRVHSEGPPPEGSEDFWGGGSTSGPRNMSG
ncbi:MAG: IS1 family transposase [Nitrososphaerota archaeon]|nr:IS1 family transposase [Nitrososphaerota archaeon]